MFGGLAQKQFGCLDGLKTSVLRSSAYLQKLPICHFDRREKSYSMIIKISQSLRSFEMTRLILKSST